MGKAARPVADLQKTRFDTQHVGCKVSLSEEDAKESMPVIHGLS